jgi:Cu/Ag efflux protein CusF
MNMMNRTTAMRVTGAALAVLLSGGLPVIAAGKTTQKATVSETVKLTATVKAIDYEKRLITLQGPNGNAMTFEASPEVTRFKEIKAGDVVSVNHTQAVAAELKKTGSGQTEQGVSVTAVKSAKTGENPGLKGQREVRATVTIDEVDLRNNMVAFTNHHGASNMVTVKQPQMREFIKSLKAGDKVDLIYTEAVVVSVEPFPKK